MKQKVHALFSPVVLRSGAVAALATCVLVCATGVPARAESPNADYKHGQDAEARQDYDQAYTWFEKAYQRNPKDVAFRTAFDRIKTTDSNMHLTKGRRLHEAGDTQGALTEFMRVVAIDAGNEAAQQEIARIRRQQGAVPSGAEIATPQAAGASAELESMGAPVELKTISSEPLTLHMTEDAKVIYQALGKTSGVNVMFDPDYVSKRIQVDLNAVSLMDALRIVGAMSNTFWRPITGNTIFVAQNTRVKRTELDEQAVQTFYLSNAWQQNDLNDVQTALRNVLPNAKVYGVASQNAIVMRGTPDELLLAQKLINDLDKPRSEVLVDFGVLEVSKNWERTMGIAWPGSIGVSLQNPNSTSNSSTTSGSSTTSSTTSSTNLTLSNLANLNSNNFAVTVGSATLNMLLTDSNTQILQDPRIRATDGQKATLTIGSKIPIATGSYQTGAATALVSSLVNTQFQYIDVGVKIEMTPTVHFDNDVTLKVHIEVSSQSGNVTISGVTEPILSQRVADQVIRLREGEASVLGGIQDDETQQSWTGIPGLSSIPILKYLFGSKDHTVKNDEIVFVVVPHVVRGQNLDEQNLRQVDTGEGQSIDLRRVANANQSAAPVNRAPAVAQPTLGTLPTGSAPAAAMQALDQMRATTPPMETPPPVSRPANPIPAAQGPPPPIAASPAAAAPAATGLSFNFQGPPNAVTNGATFQVPITVSGGSDVASVPLQMRYDPNKLTLVNVNGGDFLSKDGQAMALIHRDDGPGNVTVVASRPPGTMGVNGAGTICVLTFQAKTAGGTSITMTRSGVMNSKQQQVQAAPSQVNVVVK